MSKTYDRIYAMQESGEIALTEMRNIKGLNKQAIADMDNILYMLEDVMGFIAEIESAPSDNDIGGKA